MDIKKNIDLLNNIFINTSFSSKQKLEIIKLAKISKNINELQEHLNWDYDYENIKKI